MNITDDVPLPDNRCTAMKSSISFLRFSWKMSAGLQNGTIDLKTSRKIKRLADRQVEIIKGGRRKK